MKKINYLFILFVAASLMLVIDTDAASVKKKKSDPPKFTILTPRDGQSVVGNAITLQVLSSNVKIRSSSGRRNKANEGHLRIMIDSGKTALAYSQTYRLNIASLDDGAHKMVVELVQNEGNSFEPAVARELSFNVIRSALRTGGLQKQNKVFHPARLFTSKRI